VIDLLRWLNHENLDRVSADWQRLPFPPLSTII
jgi:hypothetical protein